MQNNSNLVLVPGQKYIFTETFENGDVEEFFGHYVGPEFLENEVWIVANVFYDPTWGECLFDPSTVTVRPVEPFRLVRGGTSTPKRAEA